jgi:hypothetical protein
MQTIMYVNQPQRLLECSKSNKNGMRTHAVTLPRHTADFVAFKDTRKLLHALSAHYHDLVHRKFTSQSSAQDLIVFNNACGNHAAAYLQAIRFEPAMTLSNSEVLICLSQYLNISHHVHGEAWSTEVVSDVYGVLDTRVY